MVAKILKMGLDILSSNLPELLAVPYVPQECVDVSGYQAQVTGLGNVIGGYGDSVFPQAQQDIQIEDAKFQYKVQHTSSDYQNQSQQISSDNQMLESAREKGMQIGRLMAQLVTAQPA